QVHKPDPNQHRMYTQVDAPHKRHNLHRHNDIVSSPPNFFQMCPELCTLSCSFLPALYEPVPHEVLGVLIAALRPSPNDSHHNIRAGSGATTLLLLRPGAAEPLVTLRLPEALTVLVGPETNSCSVAARRVLK